MSFSLFNKKSSAKDSKEEFGHLEKYVMLVRTFSLLKTAMRWERNPCLESEHLYQYENFTDLNDRRLRDGEVIGGACCNGNPKTILEIGTSYGKTTELISRNAPLAAIHTVNIPPEEISNGGEFVTCTLSREQIGSHYREKNCQNVRQIYANTKNWEPDCGLLDIVFIDGCHDSDFVYNDTVKILKLCHPGSIIMWHDFEPGMVKTNTWIRDVCRGVERLYADGFLHGPILHLQDSWVGLYQVGDRE